MDGVRHCPDCWTEYLPGITACADCGGPLSLGPLPERKRKRGGAAEKRSTATEAAASGPPDTFLLSRPGLEAEHLARALNLEGIPCTLECEGVRRPRLPDGEAGEPLAVSLPVSIYVPAEFVDAAREVVGSLEEEDLIGEQWADDPVSTLLPEGEEEVDSDVGPAVAADSRLSPRPEGTSIRLVVALVVAALVLLLFLSR